MIAHYVWHSGLYKTASLGFTHFSPPERDMAVWRKRWETVFINGILQRLFWEAKTQAVFLLVDRITSCFWIYSVVDIFWPSLQLYHLTFCLYHLTSTNFKLNRLLCEFLNEIYHLLAWRFTFLINKWKNILIISHIPSFTLYHLTQKVYHFELGNGLFYQYLIDFQTFFSAIKATWTLLADAISCLLYCLFTSK